MKILVGIMHCIENEFEDCIKSIQSQTYKDYDYFVIENFPNKQAHQALYKKFADSSERYDLFVKIDADMVLCRKTFFEEVINKFQGNPNMDHLEICVHDFFTNSLVYGLHIYSNRVSFDNKEEDIFVDMVTTTNENYVSDLNDLAPAAYHCPNPSLFQSFHFGIHKAIKALQIKSQHSNKVTCIRHIKNIIRSVLHFWKTNDKRIGLAALGATKAVVHRFDHQLVDYNNKETLDHFNKIKNFSTNKLKITLVPYTAAFLLIISISFFIRSINSTLKAFANRMRIYIKEKLKIFSYIYSLITLPLMAIMKGGGKRKRVLLDCTTANYAQYISQLTNLLKNDDRIQFVLLNSYKKDRADGRKIIWKLLPYRRISVCKAYFVKWDLIITACANSNRHLITKTRCPSLKIEHGIESGKIMNGKLMVLGKNVFDAMRKNTIRFTKIFSSSHFNKEQAVKYQPRLKDIMTVVGFLDSDKLIEARSNRDAIKIKLGLETDKSVVFILSSWGPDCLFNTIGMPLLKQAKKLMKDYHFIINVHPLEHRKKPKSQIVWGEYLRTQKKHGFIVREPDDDWTQYMAASDAIISDFTSLGLNAPQILLPTVFSPFPDNCLAEGSLISELKKFSPVLNEDASDLKEKLEQVLNNPQPDKLKDIAKKINSYPGEAKRRYTEETYKVLELSPKT